MSRLNILRRSPSPTAADGSASPEASDRLAVDRLAADPPPPTGSRTASTAPTVALLTALGVLVVGQMYTVLAMLTPMADSFATTPTQTTWTATAFGFAYAAGFLIAGPLSDRYGPRTVITGGLVGATATTLAVSVAPSLTWAVVLRIAQGLTAATFAPSAFSYIAGHLAPHRRGIALTCVTSGMLASAVLMQIGAQIVAAGLGWRTVFVLSAALMALSLWPVRRILRPTAAQDSGPSLLQAFVAVPRLLRKPRLVALYLATATVMASFVAVYTAVVVAGPPGVAGDNAALLALRASALPALVAVPLLTSALHRLAAPVRVVLAMSVAAGAVAAGSALGGDVRVLALVLLVFVAAVATAAPAVVEIVHTMASHARGAGVALYACSMFLGASLGPQLAGALSGQGFGGILRAVAVLLVVGTLLSLPALTGRRCDR
ncbi:MFS transporter [Streptomyces umbrinus]|uniref:MFS transporter n=1 Tax=Streptomyces umbrinus TaxID=67370 RepID=UPI003C2D4837